MPHCAGPGGLPAIEFRIWLPCRRGSAARPGIAPACRAGRSRPASPASDRDARCWRAPRGRWPWQGHRALPMRHADTCRSRCPRPPCRQRGGRSRAIRRRSYRPWPGMIQAGSVTLVCPTDSVTRSPLRTPSRSALRRCDQQRIVPCQLGQRTRQFLQPGIVVEAAVPEMRVGPQQQVQRPARCRLWASAAGIRPQCDVEACGAPCSRRCRSPGSRANRVVAIALPGLLHDRAARPARRSPASGQASRCGLIPPYKGSACGCRIVVVPS